MEQVKLLSMAAILTVLIWAGADSLVNQVVSVQVSFEVVPLDNTDMLVEITPEGRSQLYELQLAGPRRIVESVQSRDEPMVVRLKVADRPGGSWPISLDKGMVKRAMSEQSGEFGKLAVLSIQPPTLPINVDYMVSRDVDITLRRLTLAYDDEPQLKRTVTTARMRESKFSELAQPGQSPQIDIASDVERLLRGKTPGESATIFVTFDSTPFGPDAEFTPDTVEVTATVKADRDEAEIATVPIKPVVSFGNLGKALHAVAQDGTELTLVTQTIRVSGPTDDVAALLRGDTRAYGFIQLKEADLAQLDVLRAWTPEFHLPPGLKLAAQPNPIEFKLTSVAEDGKGG
jgi:hypothetical protein